MGGLEKDFCIKCDREGKVLSCSDSSCPISVHEECLGFPAKLDDVGNFYCPYCSYRRATEEFRQAREKALLGKKALSRFMDMQMINEDKHMYEGGISEHKELGKLQNTVKKNYNLDNENILDQAILQENPVQPEEGQEEDKFVPENAMRDFRHKDFVSGKDRSALSSKYGDNPHPSEFNDRLAVAGYETPSGPIVASGKDVYSYDERTKQHFEIVEIGRSNQLENHKILNASAAAAAAKTNENHMDESHFSDFLLGEKHGRENYFSSSAKDLDNDTDLVEEDEGHIEGEDDLRCQVQEKVSSFATDTGTQVLTLEENEGFKSMEMSCRGSDNTPASKHVKNGKRDGSSSDVCCLERSCRISSPAVRRNVEQVEEMTVPTELEQNIEPYLAL